MCPVHVPPCCMPVCCVAPRVSRRRGGVRQQAPGARARAPDRPIIHPAACRGAAPRPQHGACAWWGRARAAAGRGRAATLPRAAPRRAPRESRCSLSLLNTTHESKQAPPCAPPGPRRSLRTQSQSLVSWVVLFHHATVAGSLAASRHNTTPHPLERVGTGGVSPSHGSRSSRNEKPGIGVTSSSSSSSASAAASPARASPCAHRQRTI